MGGSIRPAEPPKALEQSSDKKKGLTDWINKLKPVNEEKDHWVNFFSLFLILFFIIMLCIQGCFRMAHRRAQIVLFIFMSLTSSLLLSLNP